MAQAQLPAGRRIRDPARQGVSPQLLIWIGVFFLLANLGVFHAIHWGMWWPVLFIGLRRFDADAPPSVTGGMTPVKIVAMQ